MGLFGRTVVGLEMDTCEARVVELKGTARWPEISVCGRIKLPDGAVKEGLVIQPQMVGKALTELWERLGIKNREVILGVTNHGVIVRKAVFPKLPPEKLDKLIHNHAQDYLPVSLENVVFNYTITEEVIVEEGKQVEVLLVAAHLDMLDGFLDALSVAHLIPQDIQVASLSLLNSFSAKGKENTIVLVDILNELGNILVVSGGIPRFTRMMRVSMKDSTGLTPSPYEASMKLQDALLSTWYQILSMEISSSINYFQAQQVNESVDKIILSGVGARIEGLDAKLEELFEIPVVVLNPLENIRAAQKQKDMVSYNMVDFASCIGLAFTGLQG